MTAAEIPMAEPLRPWSPRARALVGRLPITELAGLLAGDGVRFEDRELCCLRCQRHEWQRIDAGRAVVDPGGQRWRCTRCNAAGDRWSLERKILGDASALELLAALTLEVAS